MVDNLFPVHTDTVIGDGQGAVVFIKRNPHAQLAVSLIQIRLRQRAETQLIGRIRGVGNQLTQKDFFVGIEGMDHQVQKLFYFRLKTTSFLSFHLIQPQQCHFKWVKNR